MTTAYVSIQMRRDTAAAWTAANTVLKAGEPALETDTGKVKVGDGIRNWATLPYVADPQAVSRIPPELADAAPPTAGTASTGTSGKAARADHSHALPAALTSTTLAVSGNATIGGGLTVVGSLTGGTHKHTAADVTDFSTAVSARLGVAIKAGTNISVTDSGSGVYTIANTQTALPSLSGNGGKALTTDGTTVSWTSVSGSVASVNSKTGVVVIGAADLSDFPAQSGNTGKFLATSGSALSWQSVSVLPVQTGNSGKVLSTNGSSLSWVPSSVSLLSDFPTQAGNASKVLSTNGSSLFWASQTGTVSSVAGRTGVVSLTSSDLGDFPSLGGNTGKFLTTNGSALSWTSIASGVTSVNGLTGAVNLTPPLIVGFDEAVQDSVSTLLKAGSNIGLFYDDANNTLTISSTGGGSTATGVSSVNGKTGNVVLDIPTTASIDARVTAVAPTLLQAGSAITLTPQSNGKVEIGVDASRLGSNWSGTPQPTQVRIVTQPSSASATSGVATFSVTASGGTPPYSYVWSMAPAGSSAFSVVSNATGSVIGATTATLRLEGLTSAAHGRTYRVLVSTATATDGAVMSETAFLSSQTTDFRITSQPLSRSVPSGQTVAPDAFAVSAVAAGEPTYQWQAASPAGAGAEPSWSNISGQTSSTYGNFSVTLNAGESSRIVLYRCRVQFGGATLFSEPASLTVNSTQIVVTTQPVSATVNPANGTAVLTFAYTGAGAGAVASWQFFTSATGVPQSATAGSAALQGITFATASGGTSLTVTANGYAATGLTFDPRLRFTGTSLFLRGVVTSGASVAYTNMVPVFIPGPIITKHPDPAVTTVFGGLATPVTFSLEYLVPEIPGRTRDATVQWFRRRGSEPAQTLTGATGLSYTATALTTSDNNFEYYAVVTAQGVARSTAPAQVSVTSTTLLTAMPPSSLELREGQAGRILQVTVATGAPALLFQWERLLDGQTTWENLPMEWTAGVTNPLVATSRSFVTLAPAQKSWSGAQIRLRYWIGNTTTYLYTAPTLIVVTQGDVQYGSEFDLGSGNGIKNPTYGGYVADMEARGFCVMLAETQFASTYLYRSSDEGATWSKVTMPTAASWRAVSAAQADTTGMRWIAVAPRVQTQITFPSSLPVAEVAPAMAISVDNGVTWTPITMNANPVHNCAVHWLMGTRRPITLVAPNGIWMGSAGSLTQVVTGVAQAAKRYPYAHNSPRCQILRVDSDTIFATGILEAAPFPLEVRGAGYFCVNANTTGSTVWSKLPMLPVETDAAGATVYFDWAQCAAIATNSRLFFHIGVGGKSVAVGFPVPDYSLWASIAIGSDYADPNQWQYGKGRFSDAAALADARQSSLVRPDGSRYTLPLGYPDDALGHFVTADGFVYTAVNALYESYEDKVSSLGTDISSTMALLKIPASSLVSGAALWDCVGIANAGIPRSQAPPVKFYTVPSAELATTGTARVPESNRTMAVTDNYVVWIANQGSALGSLGYGGKYQPLRVRRGI